MAARKNMNQEQVDQLLHWIAQGVSYRQIDINTATLWNIPIGKAGISYHTRHNAARLIALCQEHIETIQRLQIKIAKQANIQLEKAS